MNKAPVLVLGASGFIGRRIVAALASSDWAEPIAAARRPVGGFDGRAVRSVQMDATEPCALARAFDGVAGVINCVAGAPETILRGAQVLAAQAAQGSPSRPIVHLSSMAVYGTATGTLDESAPLLGDISPYAQAKVAAERALAAYPRLTVLRPGIVYGPGSLWWSDAIGRLLLARRLGDLGAHGDGYCNLVHVDDVAAAAIRALQTPEAAGQALNLSLPEPPTWNEYFVAYGRALGAVPVRRITARRLAIELKVIGPVIKVVELTRALKPPIPIRPWLTDLCRHEIRLNVARAERVLALRWTPLGQGLQHTARWLLGRIQAQ